MTKEKKNMMVLHMMAGWLVDNGSTRIHSGTQSACHLLPHGRKNQSSLTGILRTMFLAVMMVVGVGGVKADDFSGTYYIANRAGYNSSYATANFYLCPSTDCYDANGEQPFLTTYKTGKVKNSVWRVTFVKKENDVDYYYIQHDETKQYLTYNESLVSGNTDRVRVHLQSSIGEDDKSLFYFTAAGGSYSSESSLNIIPKGQNRSLNPAKNNYNYYEGVDQGSPGSFTGANGATIYCGGLIGYYSQDDQRGLWFLEAAPAVTDVPTITNNFDGTITITALSGTIYYTTDGYAPTTSSSTYSTDITLTDAITVIKAMAKDGSNYESRIVTYELPKCEKPVITVSSGTVTITTSTAGASIHYTKGNTAPTSSSTLYSGSFSLDVSVIRAITVKLGYANSEEASYIDFKTVSSVDEISNMRGSYRLASGFSYSSKSIGTSSEPFKGIIDGQFNTISGESHALVAYADGATIKNVILNNVNITGGTNVGAICNEADGATKIYNCGVQSGSVSGGSVVGGLVGLIKADSKVRVVNCYNYANVSGSSNAAGIVGKNEGTVGDVRIALCMMYGNVTGASTISPVYTGNHVSNVQNFTEYNYWLYSKRVFNETKGKEEIVPQDLSYTQGNYNDQLAIADEWYLTRFPFHRHILNTHRELAAYFLFAENTTVGSVGDIDDDQVSEIGHWMEKKHDDALKYPIIEAWRTNITDKTPTDEHNDLPDTTEDYAGKLLTTMGTNGYLSVSINIGSNSYSAKLPITDMDTLRYDYTYGKVILPFANEYEVNTDYSRICTGWEITVSGGENTLANYNFSDRNCTDKDNYDATSNPYIFAQGGYYIVPKGVTSISITAHFANAYYLSDPSYEIGLSTTYTGPTQLGGSVPATFHGKPVYTNLKTLLDAMPAAANPHVQAIVLVGNYHCNDGSLGNKAKAFTLMSIDADNNQEPDYGFYSYYTTSRPVVPSLRFDFLPLIPVGMAAHVGGSTGYPSTPIWKVSGWFEQTETCVSYSGQCEIDSGKFNYGDDGNGNNRWIANSGYFVQIVRSRETNCSKLSYIQIGGNAYVKEFYPGAHSDQGTGTGDRASRTTTIVPVNVTGGEIVDCFMTGYNTYGCTADGSDIRFYCAGGKIHKFLGAYMEAPTSASVNMTAKIDHALIGRFFGGGTSTSASIGGKIDVTIDNSKVDFYCGGPEFSNATANPVVETTANNTVFGEYYGAGFGGTSITYNREEQSDNVGIGNPTTTFPLSFSNDYKYLTGKDGYGIGTCYKFEYIYHSFNLVAVARFYTGYAQFSLATTGNVTNKLNGCTVKGDFYGAGCQGKVAGTVSSELTDCTILGNAFGGGFKAESNDVAVYSNTKQPTYSVFNKDMALFTEFGENPNPATYTWVQGDEGNKNAVVEGETQIYTDVIMTELGNVTGAISITIENGTVAHDVYGGGNESKSLDNTTVILKGNTTVNGNVFGGGNKAAVSGSTTVNIEE